MINKIIKKAGAEGSSLSDPRTNLNIFVTTTVRKKYREYFKGKFSHREVLYDLSNKQLNDIIAQDFAASSEGVIHMFLSKSSSLQTQRREWIEIRKVANRDAFNFFFSVIRPDGIYIINVNTRYIALKKPRVFDPTKTWGRKG